MIIISLYPFIESPEAELYQLILHLFVISQDIKQDIELTPWPFHQLANHTFLM